MVGYILIGIIVLIVFLQLFLRTNTAIGFLALCAGSILVDSSGANAGLMASSLTSGMDASVNIAQLALLLAPFVVCAALLRGQVHKALLPIALLPAVCTALLGALLVVPLLSGQTQAGIVTSDAWSMIQQYKELIVVLGLVASIVMLPMTIKKPQDKHKKGRN